MAQHQFAAGHALADIIVGVAFEIHVQAARIPDAETLSNGAGEFQNNGLVFHAGVAVADGDFTGQTRADRAMNILHLITEFRARFVFNRRQRIGDHLFGQLAFVKGFVMRFGAELGFVIRYAAVTEQRTEIQVPLFIRVAFQQFQQIGAADQIGQLAAAELRQQFAHFTGNETEIVHHHVHLPDEMIAAQDIILSGDAGGAVIEMTDAQIFTAHGYHRAGAEAETFRAEDRGLDHVQPGFQTAVGLQAHLVAQIVGAQ